MAYEVKVENRAIETKKEGGSLPAGITSGIMAGAVMAVFLMFYSSVAGMGFWTPLRMIAASFLGVPAMVGGAGTLLLGLILHFAVAVFWGVIFASIIRRNMPASTALRRGILYGAVVWAIMTYIALPVLDLTMYQRVALMPGAWFFAHLIYGACLFNAPEIKRGFETRIIQRRSKVERKEPVGA